MNRKNEVSALLSKARAAEQKGDYAASFFNLGSALALSDQLDEAAEAYRKAFGPENCELTGDGCFNVFRPPVILVIGAASESIQ